MALKSSRVVSSSSCPVTTTAPVTISCPAPRAAVPTAVSPAVETTAFAPTEAAPTTGVDINALLAQLGLTPTATAGAGAPGVPLTTPQQIFTNPATQLGTIHPLAALAAVNPAAALAFLNPTLGIFNPAINPNAALLAFNPAGAPTQALASKQGPATLPFGKFPWGI